MKLRYVIDNGTTTRELPDRSSHPPQYVSGFRGLSQAPGGFIDASFSITAAEYNAHSDIWGDRPEIRVYDDDDPGQDPCWAGTLTDPQESGGNVSLQAQGNARKADKEFNRLLWQSQDLDGWELANSDPFDYDIDPQIEASVHGQFLQWKVPKKATFRRPNGTAKLTQAANIGDQKVYISHAGFLKRGDSINIDGEIKTVANSYDKGETTIPLTSALTGNHADGQGVEWSVPAGPDWWKTGLVFWPGVNVTRISFDIRKPDGGDTNYDLEICRATGPSGSLTVQDTVSLGNNGPDSKTVTFSSSPDLVCLRIIRKAEGKTEAGFRVRLKNIVVAGLSNTVGSYSTSAVIGDVFDRLGGTKTVQTSSVNAMPLDTEDIASAKDVLDQVPLHEDRIWLAFDDGTQTHWHYRDWGSTTWTLATPQFPVTLHPRPRFNWVRGLYRTPGGVRRVKRVEASPSIGGTETFPLDLDDPLPRETSATILYQIIANRVSEKRWTGTATFSTIQTPAGSTIPASRVRVGDKLNLPYNGDKTLRISELVLEESKVTVTFPANDPLIDRLQARRRLLIARHVPAPRRDFGGLVMRRPKQLVNQNLTAKHIEKRRGRHHFRPVFDFDEVTEDINGVPIFPRKYVAEFRYVDEDGDPFPDGHVGHGIYRESVSLKDLDDPTEDELPTKIIGREWRQPHRWGMQARGFAEAFSVDKPGITTDWTDPEYCTIPKVANPWNVQADHTHRRVGILWNAPVDPDEGGPDQRVNHYRVQRWIGAFDTGTLVDDHDHVVDLAKRFRTAPGDQTNYLIRVEAHNAYCTESSDWVTASGKGQKLQQDDMGNDSVGEWAIQPNALRERHIIRAAKIISSLIDSGARIAIIDPADGNKNDRINIYNADSVKVASILGRVLSGNQDVLNLDLHADGTGTTVGAAGGASALPATPVEYLKVGINGSLRKIPLYLP